MLLHLCLIRESESKQEILQVQEWRTELASLSYSIHCWPGKGNVAFNTQMRAFYCSGFSISICTYSQWIVQSRSIPSATVCVQLKIQKCVACQVYEWLKLQFKAHLIEPLSNAIKYMNSVPTEAEIVLCNALHSLRYFLSTTTNTTP